jgi:hypothetical protein
MEKFEQETAIQEKNLFFSIWMSPKLTLDFILKTTPNKYLRVLFILGGISYSVTNISSGGRLGHISLTAILSLAILTGAISGAAGLYGFSSLLRWTGRWLNGRADYDRFVTVLAWSGVPSICSLLVWILKFVAFGSLVFAIDPNVLNTVEVIIYYILVGFQLVLEIWSIIILIAGIMLIQKFNAAKATLNLILPFILFAVAILVIIAIFYLIGK